MSSVKDFEYMLQLAYLRLTAPRRDEALFAAWKDREKAAAEKADATPERVFSDSIDQVMYARHPRLWLSAKPADFDRVSLDRVMDICRDAWSDVSGAHITIVGNIDEAQCKKLTAQYFGALPAKGQPPVPKDNNIDRIKGRNELILYRGKAPKSQVRLFWYGDATYSDALDLHIDLLTEVLNIRFIEKIREELSGAYIGAFNGSISQRFNKGFSAGLSFPCAPENVEKLIAATFNLSRGGANQNQRPAARRFG
jgi:zinc protease